MKVTRREFVGNASAAGLVGALVASGLLSPRDVLAARPEKLFELESFDEVVAQLGGSMTESGEISVKAPDIAENGAVVPVSVKTTLANVETVSIVVEKNPSPLAATFDLMAGSGGAVSTRIKMGETSPVYALVKAGGKLYGAKKEVKVTIGGCGG